MELFNKIYRNLYYQTILKGLERKNSKLNNIDRKSTIAIFANPRGGSTWLGEILSRSIENSSLMLEPLYRGVYRTDGKMPTGYKSGTMTKELDYWYYQPILENEVWEESRDFFKKLLNRELLPLSMTYENRLSQIPTSTTFIYKFCYGNLLMPWLAEEFDLSCIFLIRHPGAVIASQLRHGSWSHLNSSSMYPFILPEFRNSNYFEKYTDILRKIKTPEENLAAMWAMSTLHIVGHPKNNVRWNTIAYEQLYDQPEETLENLFDRIGIKTPERILDLVKDPSKTTIRSSLESLKDKSQLDKWRRGLSNDQVSRISNILEEFGVDYYSMTDNFPDKEKLLARSEQQ